MSVIFRPGESLATREGAFSSSSRSTLVGPACLSYFGRHPRMMKNRIPLIVAALLASLFAGCSKKPVLGGWSSSSTIVINPAVPIGSLHSGMTIQEVIAELGQPTRTNAAGLEFSGFGLFICPASGELTLFPPFAGRTKEGIGMGSSRAEVISAYGEPAVAKITKPGFELLRYDLLGIRFQLHDAKVDWIDVNSRP